VRLAKTSVERKETPFLFATASEIGLGTLPLGSAQSRAAARALLEMRRAKEGDAIRFVVLFPGR
jgi:hypothetical protein